jgi:hypothetical protein
MGRAERQVRIQLYAMAHGPSLAELWLPRAGRYRKNRRIVNAQLRPDPVA